jgi:hypothetical protein
MIRAFAFVLALLAGLAAPPAEAAKLTGILDLGDLAITTASTQTGTEQANLAGATGVTLQLRLAYGSAGTKIQAYVQTSLDQGTTWIDIACVTFTTAGATRVVNLSAMTPRTTELTPSDGALADDTAIDGVLGDRLRLKVISTGTYGTSTVLSARAAPRG